MFKWITSLFNSWFGSVEKKPKILNHNDYRRDTAYLVVQFTTGSPVPIVQHVGIFSDTAEGLTGISGQVSATIISMTGKNYHEASRNLEEWVFQDPNLAWARPWFEKDDDGRFTKLFEMQRFVQRCVDLMQTIEVVEE
jgi:hypothetical protein